MSGPGGMEVVEVLKVVREAQNISTLMFSPSDEERWGLMDPGQFLMVWLPGVDEVPMSVSYLREDPLQIGITVQDIGDATGALCSVKKGERLGIRGPYGRGFTFPDRRMFREIIGVSGGVGGASTILAMERAKELGYRTTNLVGARTKAMLLFRKRWREASDEMEFATDDGSSGRKGFVTDLLEEELSSMTQAQRKATMVMTCGPELMMAKVYSITRASGVLSQFSLERFMKCGIGLCDSCSVNGRRVCMDGPVFTSNEISRMDEFGSRHRDRSGRLVPMTECVR